MIDLKAPDPFDLAAWNTNRLPINNPTKTVLLLCSLINVVYGWPFPAVFERYELGVSVNADEERKAAFALA